MTLTFLPMYRYILEPYSGQGSRIMCPKCRHRRDTFKRYIDTHTQTYLADHVGRCDRQEQCGYHYPPREYFADNPGLAVVESARPATPAVQQAPQLLPWTLVEQTLRNYNRNNFVRFLAKLFGGTTANELVKRYCIGTASHWPGATIFWQLDYHDRARAGKVMLYNATTGKRVKEPYNHITWVHTLLNAGNAKQCLFGEHLLATDPHKIVALVESEKTAIIGSAMEPNYIWLAASGLDGLNPNKCKVLQEREVRLYPDVNAYDKWQLKAREMNLHFPAANFSTDKTLKETATPLELEQGIDLADRWIEQLTFKPKIS